MNVLHLLRVTRQKVKVDLLAECQNQKRMDERKSQKEHLTFDPSYFRAATTTYGGLSNSARNALWKPVGHRTPDDVRILTVGPHLIDLIRESLHKNRRWIISWCLPIFRKLYIACHFSPNTLVLWKRGCHKLSGMTSLKMTESSYVKETWVPECISSFPVMHLCKERILTREPVSEFKMEVMNGSLKKSSLVYSCTHTFYCISAEDWDFALLKHAFKNY